MILSHIYCQNCWCQSSIWFSIKCSMMKFEILVIGELTVKSDHLDNKIDNFSFKWKMMDLYSMIYITKNIRETILWSIVCIFVESMILVENISQWQIYVDSSNLAQMIYNNVSSIWYKRGCVKEFSTFKKISIPVLPILTMRITYVR